MCSLDLTDNELTTLYYHCIIANLLSAIQNCEQYYNKIFIISIYYVKDHPELVEIIAEVNKNFTFKIFESIAGYNKLTESSIEINDINNLIVNTSRNLPSIKRTKQFLNCRGLKKIFKQIDSDPNLQFIMSK